ncbi:MAG: HupE/UreJ family protein [Verrucomicrobiota bacterium]
MDWNNIGTFFNHGVKHVLEGWDHLLFASALVLALTGFWEIFKVIGVFTIAHSLTAALTVMRGAPLLSPGIVEPCIAGSIIFVAVENMIRPAAARSRRRLIVAFCFGLVHGMGLAGALLENLSGLSGAIVAWAVTAFCLGVEVGHLCVVAPLSGVLKIGRDQWPQSFRSITLLYGSALIAIGGIYYLLAALGVIGGGPG